MEEAGGKKKISHGGAKAQRTRRKKERGKR